MLNVKRICLLLFVLPSSCFFVNSVSKPVFGTPLVFGPNPHSIQVNARFEDGSLINPAVKRYLPALASISFYGALKALETRAWFRPFLTTQGSSSNGKYCLSLLSECALKYVLTAVIYKSVRKALKPTKVAPSVDRAEDESFCGYD